MFTQNAVMMNRAEEIFQRIVQGQAKAIEEMIAQNEREDTWLEFKSYDNFNRAKERMAQAISGFGNTDGGVLVWGVRKEKDPTTGIEFAASPHHVDGVEQFAAKLDTEISRATMPAHSGVRNLAFIVDKASGAGFAVTYVPLSPARPIQRLYGGTEFVMRAGESFRLLPYRLISGMFGRTSPPEVRAGFHAVMTYRKKGPDRSDTPGREQADKLLVTLYLSVENIGSVLARDLYLHVTLDLPWNFLRCKTPHKEVGWIYRSGISGRGQSFFVVTASDSLRLAPDEGHGVFEVELSFTRNEGGDFDTKGFVVESVCGADGTIPHRLVFQVSKADIDEHDKRLSVSGDRVKFDPDIYLRSNL